VPGYTHQRGATLLSLAALPAAAVTALVIGFYANPAGLAIHLFTFCLVLLIAFAFLGGSASPSAGRFLLPTVRLVSTIVALEGVLPVLLAEAPVPPLLTTNAVQPPLWRAAFQHPSQALAKDLALPQLWRDQPVYVRIDLASRYDGAAGFHVEVNDVPIGQVSNAAPGPRFLAAPGYIWAIHVPFAILEQAPYARVVLRPSAIDPALAVAGHPDPRVDPVVPGNSRFFTGAAWLTTRLAGPDGPPASGTYRIWLLTQLNADG
jgi:hypothetical protein